MQEGCHFSAMVGLVLVHLSRIRLTVTLHEILIQIMLNLKEKAFNDLKMDNKKPLVCIG